MIPGARDRFDIYYRVERGEKLLVAVAMGIDVVVIVSSGAGTGAGSGVGSVTVVVAVVVVVACGWQTSKYCRSFGLCPLSPASLSLAIDLPCSGSPSFVSYIEGSMLQCRKRVVRKCR